MKPLLTNEVSYMNSTTPKNNLRVSKPTLWRLEQQAGFPNKIRISSRCCVYRKADLDTWLAGKEV